MSMEYIRRTYGVPAKRGGRVKFTGHNESQLGTIVRCDGAYIRIRLDGHKHHGRYHPTWCLRYFPAPHKHDANHGDGR